MFCTLYVDMTKAKETTVHDVEGMILERLDILQNGETKEQKKKARSEIIKLERHLKDVHSKYYNGHKYPERMAGLPDDKPMNKEEVLKLIDSVDVPIKKGAFDKLANNLVLEKNKDLPGLMI